MLTGVHAGGAIERRKAQHLGNKEVRQPDSSDEAAEQRSPDSGGGSGAKRADQGEPNESKHRLDSDPGSDDTGDTVGPCSGTQCSS